MKRLILLIAALLALSATAAAQNRYSYREILDDPVKKINIHAGWVVKLVPRTDDSIYLELISHDSDEAVKLAQNEIFYYADKTLTLRWAGITFLGREVEIHANFQNIDLCLMPGSSVSADSLTLSYIELKEGSYFKVGRLHCRKYPAPSIYIHDGILEVDTLSGGRLNVDVYGEGQLSVNHHEQDDLFVELKRGHGTNCYSFPDSSAVVVGKHRFPSKYHEDTIRHITVWDLNKTKWDGNLSLYCQSIIKFHTTAAGWNKETGWLTNISGAPISSPYASVMDFELNIPLETRFQLNPHLKLSTGWAFRFDFTPMSHKVKVDGNGHLQLADGADHFANIATSSYMGIPVNLTWSPAKTRYFDFGVDLFAGFNSGSRMWEFGSGSDNNILHSTSTKTSYLNPFKLELGFSIYQRVFSGLTRLRLYTNLLPDYRNLPELPKCRTFGVNIKF